MRAGRTATARSHVLQCGWISSPLSSVMVLGMVGQVCMEIRNELILAAGERSRAPCCVHGEPAGFAPYRELERK